MERDIPKKSRKMNSIIMNMATYINDNKELLGLFYEILANYFIRSLLSLLTVVGIFNAESVILVL